MLAEWKRQLSRAGAWSKDVLVCLDRTRALGLAAETSFWLFVSLVPLAAIAGLLAARFSTNNWSDVAPLSSSLPAATRQLVSAELMKLATWNEGSVGAGSVAVFVWLASTGVHAIFDTLEAPRPRHDDLTQRRARGERGDERLRQHDAPAHEQRRVPDQHRDDHERREADRGRRRHRGPPSTRPQQPRGVANRPADPSGRPRPRGAFAAACPVAPGQRESRGSPPVCSPA